jgi:hypothetical protein
MFEQEISAEWVERALGSPERKDLDTGHRNRGRAFARIEEHGNRWLRVVYETEGDVLIVVTAFFDRNAGR